MTVRLLLDYVELADLSVHQLLTPQLHDSMGWHVGVIHFKLDQS